MNWLLACVFFAIIFCELNCAGIPESDSNPKLDSNPKSHSGNGIQIATADSTSFTLNDENLKKLKIMLEAEDIKDLEIVVVSIAGTFKWGKSFLMNFFIRYLEANESNRSDWLCKDELISGFDWGKKHTRGISIWNKIFKRTLSNGKNVAIILIDTQGLHSTKNGGFNEDARIYAFSALSSSVQLYNEGRYLNEQHFGTLDLFSGYCSLGNQNNTCEQFQNLNIIVRDKPCTIDCKHGRQNDYDELKIHQNNTKSKEEQLKRIKKYYEHIDLFYLPSPSVNVTEDPEYDGNLTMVNPFFIKNVKNLAEYLFASNNLVIKKIDNQSIKARDFLFSLETYAKILNSKDLPDLSTYMQTILNIKYESWKKDRLELYKKLMENKIKPCDSKNEISYLSEEELQYTHNLFKNESTKEFPFQKKLNSEEICQQYMRELKDDIDNEFNKNFRKSNKRNKDCFKSKVERFYRLLVDDIIETYKYNISKEVKYAPNFIEDGDFMEMSHYYIANATNDFDAQDKYKTHPKYPEETAELFKGKLVNEINTILAQAKEGNKLKFPPQPNSSIMIRSNVDVMLVFIVIAIFSCRHNI